MNAAQPVLTIHQFNVNNLPKRGIVAVLGAGLSGKTSIVKYLLKSKLLSTVVVFGQSWAEYSEVLPNRSIFSDIDREFLDQFSRRALNKVLVIDEFDIHKHHRFHYEICKCAEKNLVIVTLNLTRSINDLYLDLLKPVIESFCLIIINKHTDNTYKICRDFCKIIKNQKEFDDYCEGVVNFETSLCLTRSNVYFMRAKNT